MAQVVFSALGWTYIGLASAWTVIVFLGMVFLFRHRRLPFLQMRRLPLIFAAVVILHIFAFTAMMGATIGSYISCDAQFWIMSIYLPLGMALLQAANSAFFYVAGQQRKFAVFNNLDEYTIRESALPVDPTVPWWMRPVERLRRLDQVTKIVVYIGVGITINLLLTFLIYFGSEIFHPNYGLFNVKVPGTEQQRQTVCFEGWEWWLSIAWQFFWAWIYAPFMLWKTRNIHDTNGWRLTTISCCIAGLPASPMWLAALYAPEMGPVNAVFFPPQWFALSIFFVEIFTIILPCWQVVRTHNLRQDTLEAIASWETRQQLSSGNPDAVSTKNSGGTPTLGSGRRSVRSKASAASRGSTLTLTALENVLRNNPQPLLEFAALKDFSGENISFLSHVAEWRRSWALSTRMCEDGPAERLEHFVRAVRIYAHFVSFEYSEFPVNISSRIGKALHQIFDRAAHELHGGRRGSGSGGAAGGSGEAARGGSAGSDGSLPSQDKIDDVSPFGHTCPVGMDEQIELHAACGMDLQETLGKANLHSVMHMADIPASPGMLDLNIPTGFCLEVFDDAEKEIKYLVLTNTWPKFVQAVGLETSSQMDKSKRDKKRKHEKGGDEEDGNVVAGVKRLLSSMKRIV